MSGKFWITSKQSSKCREFLCIQTAPLTSELRVKEREILWSMNTCLHVQYTFLCNWESVHTYTCCMHMTVCMSSCIARPLPLYPPHCSGSLVLSDGCERYLATHSSPHQCLWMVSSVTAHNEGWILWPPTPTWHIHKSLTVTSDIRGRENQ